jgi:putative endonuclease
LSVFPEKQPMPIKKPEPAQHLVNGRLAEMQALQYLQQQGLRWLASNYRCKLGELDLLLWEGNTLVVVEVRYRKNDHYGGAAASITDQKQQRIIKATQHYVIMHNLNQVAVRFDVVALTAGKPLEWIKNAFQT